MAAKAKRFRAVLEKGNRALGWTIARVPFEPAKEWKQMVRQRVRGEVNGHAFRTSLFPDTRGGFCLLVNRAMQAGAGVKLGEFGIKEAGVKLLEDQATVGVGGGGKIRSVPFILDSLALGADEERNVAGLFEGPFPWEETFGFRLVGMVGHDFFRKSAVTFDFDGMRMTLQRR